MKEKTNNIVASLAPEAPAANYATVEQLNNEIRSRTNGDNSIRNSLTVLSRDYQQYKENNDDAVNSKQNSVSNDLKTVNKTIVGSINEIKENNDKNIISINENKNSIEELKKNSVQLDDLNTKQDKTDTKLTTTDKTIVGAINEIKEIENHQSALIEHNTGNINMNSMHINKNTMSISKNTEEIESIKESIKNIDSSQKQDKTDDGLATEDKTIVGAINEINANKVSQDDFSSLEENILQYQEVTNNSLDTKQNKTDSKLTTTDKTIIGAINEIKANIQDVDLSGKQDKTDDGLTTEDKTIVGAINEVKATDDEQNANISKNTEDIATIKENYLTKVDVENKQDKTDDELKTEDKTIVGAINEVKISNDEHFIVTEQNIMDISKNSRNINTNSSKIEYNTTEIEKVKENYLTKVEAETKQDKTDDGLTTTDKTIIGAINEVKATDDEQNANISKNTEEIESIKESIKDVDISGKQDKTDDGLATEDKTIVGAINEAINTINAVDTKKVDHDEYSNFQEDFIQFQTMVNNSLDTMQTKKDKELTTTDKTIVGAINEAINSINAVDTKKVDHDEYSNFQEDFIQFQTMINNSLDTMQTKKDKGLATEDKTIVGAINEIKAHTSENSPTWTNVGVTENARSWKFNLVADKTYQVCYHWNASDDAKSKIYKQFTWGGTDMSLETYVDEFGGVKIGLITVLGSASVVELVANKTGIIMKNKSGSPKVGRIISLQQRD